MTDAEIQGAIRMAQYWLRRPELMVEAGFEQVCRELYTISRALSVLGARERVAREDRAAEVRLRGEERVAELEREANKP